MTTEWGPYTSVNTAAVCVYMHICVERWEDCCAVMQVLDVDKESSGSKQKFCPHSIFSMSAGVGRGSLKCEDDRSLLSQGLWSDILMCLCLNHTPTHTQPQTSDIPTYPETFRFLTSSYHTLRLHFDLLCLFFSIFMRNLLCTCIFGLENICSFEHGRWIWQLLFAEYLTLLPVRWQAFLHS